MDRALEATACADLFVFRFFSFFLLRTASDTLIFFRPPPHHHRVLPSPCSPSRRSFVLSSQRVISFRSFWRQQRRWRREGLRKGVGWRKKERKGSVSQKNERKDREKATESKENTRQKDIWLYIMYIMYIMYLDSRYIRCCCPRSEHESRCMYVRERVSERLHVYVLYTSIEEYIFRFLLPFSFFSICMFMRMCKGSLQTQTKILTRKSKHGKFEIMRAA